MDKSRVVLITGVSREEGLGFEIARQLAASNCKIIISARNFEKAKMLANKLNAKGYSVYAMQLDLTNEGSILSIAKSIEKEFGMLDILINNAAGGFDPEQSITQSDFDIVKIAFETNCFGVWKLCDVLLPLLKKSTQGRIVNISSEASSFGSPNGLRNFYLGGLLPAYSISKNALNAFTVKLAHALKDTSILVNAVCPGQTATHPETDDEENARPASESAKGIIWAAMLPANGPTGGFFRDGEAIPF